MAFAVVMGLLGGLLPALRGSRMPITQALREA
jgi:ABC-type lipoprotein release transport system permease subunit